MNNLAEIHHSQGRLYEARVFYEEVLHMKEEMGDRSSLAFTLFDLAEVLLESLRDSAMAEVEVEWQQEIERRVAAYDRGEVQTYLAEDVFAEARRLAQ